MTVIVMMILTQIKFSENYVNFFLNINLVPFKIYVIYSQFSLHKIKCI